MDPDQLPHLETFARAAELGSFTAAAAALRLTQAAVSQRIRALERALNVSLFRREGGHVFLNEAGQCLHSYAQRILLLHEEARARVTGRKAPVTGELLLAASSVPGEHLLPTLLAGFHKRYPHIVTRMTVSDTSAVLHQLERGEAQLGVVGGQIDNPHLVYRPFACDRLVLVVPADHAWRKRKCVSLAEMLRQPLVVREAGSGSRWCLERTLASAGHSGQRLRIALELGSNEAIKQAVLRGAGLAVLSDLTVAKELQAKKLHTVQVTGLPVKREIYVAWDRRRALPIPARLFLDFVES